MELEVVEFYMILWSIFYIHLIHVNCHINGFDSICDLYYVSVPIFLLNKKNIVSFEILSLFLLNQTQFNAPISFSRYYCCKSTAMSFKMINNKTPKLNAKIIKNSYEMSFWPIYHIVDKRRRRV